MTDQTELAADPAYSDGLLSLFCGAGGLDLGFERAGFKVAAAFDLRAMAVASYNHNRPRASRVARTKDVRDIDLAYLDGLFGRTFQPFGVVGGPPCQSFSMATHSRDDDPRHDLPLKYAGLLAALNKRSPVHFFAFENVPGLLKAKHRERLEVFLKAFKSAGFTLGQASLNASDFGVPQNRPRIIIVGLNTELYGDATWIPPEPRRVRPKTVREAIGHLPEPTFWGRGLDASTIPYHPNHWCMNPKSASFSTPGRLTPGTARGRSFRTLQWDQPSPTVAYGNREVHVHPSCKRRLSVHEALLLQGFPPKFELLGSLSSQITQVSEAVPPALAAAIARSIIQSLTGGQQDLETGEAA